MGSNGGGGGENGSYHLSLLLEALPGNAATNVSNQGDGSDGPPLSSSSSSSAFDFVCSSSGVAAAAAAAGAGGEDGQGGGGDKRDEAVAFNRVCALRGEVVHIFTLFHRADDGGKGKPAGILDGGKHSRYIAFSVGYIYHPHLKYRILSA